MTPSSSTPRPKSLNVVQNPHDSTMNSTIYTTLILDMTTFDLLAWRWQDDFLFLMSFNDLDLHYECAYFGMGREGTIDRAT
jgi:hypothetical protein